MTTHVDAVGHDDKTLYAWDTTDPRDVAILFDRMVTGTQYGPGALTIIRLRETTEPCPECAGL